MRSSESHLNLTSPVDIAARPPAPQGTLHPQIVLLPSSFPEERLNLLSGHCVEHIAGSEPAFAGDADAVAHDIDAVGGVGIGIDRNLDSLVARPVQIAPVEIEARGMGVDLDTDAMFGGRVDHGVYVHRIALATKQQAPGW